MTVPCATRMLPPCGPSRIRSVLYSPAARISASCCSMSGLTLSYAIYGLSTTLPHCPFATRSNPSANWSRGRTWVTTGLMLRPALKSPERRYQVWKSRRPVTPYTRMPLKMISFVMSKETCASGMPNGGRVTLFGIPEAQVSFDMTNEIIFKGIRVYGVTGRRLFQTWYRLAGLFKAGLNIKPVVTHVLPLDKFAEGFDLVAKGQCGKVVLRP